MSDFRERTLILLVATLLFLGAKSFAVTEQPKRPPLGVKMISDADEEIWQYAYASALLPPHLFLLELTREVQETELDCSHFVHELYERAGLPYTYAPSRDLYDGVSEFRRVFSPEPGDLIVWRGHVGIVTDAYEHLFFSALRSGVKIAAYDSGYWKRRGRPRFFRYTILDEISGPPLESKQKTALQGATK